MYLKGLFELIIHVSLVSNVEAVCCKFPMLLHVDTVVQSVSHVMSLCTSVIEYVYVIKLCWSCHSTCTDGSAAISPDMVCTCYVEQSSRRSNNSGVL